MRERGTEERSSSSLLSLTLWEEAEVEMFVGNLSTWYPQFMPMMDDTADAREAQEEDAYFYIYIYI